MDSVGTIAAVIILALILVGGAAMAQLAVQETGDQHSFEETFNTTSAGQLVEFNHSNEQGVYYSDTVNVTDENGTQLREGQDYDWHQPNGTLEVLSGELENDNGSTIQYSYRDPSETQVAFADRLATLFSLAYGIPIIGIVALLLLGMGMLSNLT